jgi:pyridoxamine 5'-phosphate oxidase family protein
MSAKQMTDKAADSGHRRSSCRSNIGPALSEAVWAIPLAGTLSAMSVFTSAEIAYLESQRVARIATAGPDCQPHVVPVAFRYNPDEDTIDVGGHGFAGRKKYRDVQRNPRVAIVIDDLATVDPWRPRMIEVRGEVHVLPNGGETVGPGFDPEMFRIRVRRIVSIGIEGGGPYALNARTVE